MRLNMDYRMAIALLDGRRVSRNKGGRQNEALY